MPKIPIVQTPQLRRSGDNYEPVAGPGLGYRADNSLSLLGNGIAAAGNHLGNAIAEFGRKKQQADDQDNIGEIELRTKRRYTDMQNYMRENPNDYENFPERRRQTSDDLSREVKPFLDKLSEEGRKRADLYLRSNASDMELFAGHTATMADITMKQVHYEGRIRQYAKTGDLESAAMQLENAVETGVFSPDKVDEWRTFIEELADFGAAQRLIESGDFAAVEQLKAKNEDGTYRNFRNLPAETRKKLINYGIDVANQRQKAADDAFLADLYQGRAITIDELDAMRRDGKIPDDSYNRCRGWLEHHYAALERERTGKITAAQKAEEEAQKAETAQLLLDIELTDWSMTPERNAEQKAELLKQAEAITDPERQLKIRQALDRAVDDGLKGKGVFTTPEGAVVMDYLKKTFLAKSLTEPFQNLTRGRPGWFAGKEDSQKFQRDQYYQAVEVAKKMLQQGKSDVEVIEYLERRKEKLNAGKVENMLKASVYGSWGGAPDPAAALTAAPVAKKSVYDSRKE